MRVYRDCGFAEGGVENDARRFSSDTRQGFQFFARGRYLSLVQFNEPAAGFDDVFGLAVKETNGLDVFLQSRLAEIEERLRRARDRIQLSGRLVDADISRLCRQDDGDQ
jgi:hypothetical protein